MATHLDLRAPPSLSQVTTGGDIAHLIHVFTKLASNADPPAIISQPGRKSIEFSHFTHWSSLSVEQKAKVLDLIIFYYNKGVTNPNDDLVNSTDPAFINNSALRQKSAEFSQVLEHGIAQMRDRTEDRLRFSFELSVDKLSGYGNNSRDLAKCVEYYIPPMYRDDKVLHENCHLFSNAIAAVVLGRANKTPFRRNYSGRFLEMFEPFILKPDARLPSLVDVVEATRPAIEDVTANLGGSSKRLTTAAASTAPSSPMPRANRNVSIHSQDSIWSRVFDIDFEDPDVQRALKDGDEQARRLFLEKGKQKEERAQEVVESVVDDIMDDVVSTMSGMTKISEETMSSSATMRTTNAITASSKVDDEMLEAAQVSSTQVVAEDGSIWVHSGYMVVPAQLQDPYQHFRVPFANPHVFAPTPLTPMRNRYYHNSYIPMMGPTAPLHAPPHYQQTVPVMSPPGLAPPPLTHGYPVTSPFIFPDPPLSPLDQQQVATVDGTPTRARKKRGTRSGRPGPAEAENSAHASQKK